MYLGVLPNLRRLTPINVPYARTIYVNACMYEKYYGPLDYPSFWLQVTMTKVTDRQQTGRENLSLLYLRLCLLVFDIPLFLLIFRNVIHR